MDILEWLSRYARFLSPESSYQLVQSYRDMYQNSTPEFRAHYTQADHGSESLQQLILTLKKLR